MWWMPMPGGVQGIPKKRSNGQNGTTRDFSECLWQLCKNCFPFSYRLVLIDLLIIVEIWKLSGVYPSKNCLVKEKNKTTTKPPQIFDVSWELVIALKSLHLFSIHEKKQTVKGYLSENLAALCETSSSLQAELIFSLVICFWILWPSIVS